MLTRTHSILVIVNALADVERSIRDRSDDGDDLDPRRELGGNLASKNANRMAACDGNRDSQSIQARTLVSWGILFDSEYLWAPDIGPMLIVCPHKESKSLGKNKRASNAAFSNCCIVQFETQLSTRSSLRIFHSR